MILSATRSRRSILGTAIVACAILLNPIPADSSSCCGGDASSGLARTTTGEHGLLDLKKLFPRKQLRLTIYPGTKKQNVIVRNFKTRAPIQTIPIGGKDTGAPISVTFPIPRKGSLSVELKPQTPQTPSADGSDCQSGGDGTSGTYSSTIEGSDTCPPKCEPPTASIDSGGIPSTDENNEVEYPEEGGTCEDNRGDGEPDNEDNGSDDEDTEDGSGDNGGGGFGDPNQEEFDSNFDQMKEMRGGVQLNMGLGSNKPSLTFSASDVTGLLNGGVQNFRNHLSSPFIPKGSPSLVEGPATLHTYTRLGRRYVTDAGSTRIRALFAGDVAVNIRELPGVLAVEFYDTKALMWDSDVKLVNGYFDVGKIYIEGDTQKRILSNPFCTWTFSKEIVNGVEWLQISKSHEKKNGKWQPSLHSWRFRQVKEGPNDGILVTQKVDVKTGLLSEFFSAEDEIAQTCTRGERFTTSDNVVLGWKAVAFKTEANAILPVLDPSEAGLTKVHISGSGNTVWQWSTSGMFEKTSVTPHRNAPLRTTTLLRPWGTTIDPKLATDANSHATIQTIYPLPTGWSINTVKKANGHEYKWQVNTKVEWRNPGEDYYMVHETEQQYPDGWNSIPSIDYTRRRLRESGNLFSGRTLFRQYRDGATASYTYTAANPSEDPFAPALTVTEVHANLAGISRQVERMEDSFGRELSLKSFLVFNAALYPVEETRSSYDPQSGALAKVEGRDLATVNTWRTRLERVYNEAHQLQAINQTDEAGVVTADSNFDDQERPLTTTRSAYSKDGTVLVPSKIIRRTFNQDGYLTSERIIKPTQSGETDMQVKAWNYYEDGRIKSETVNSAVTTFYKYEPFGAGGEKVKVYRQVGADESSQALVSEFTSNWCESETTISGPEVLTEATVREVIPVNGNGRIRETITRGDSGANIKSVREVDGLRRTRSIAIPGTISKRTFEFDAYNRPISESAAGAPARSYAYNGNSTTVTVFASPDPTRVSIQNREIAQVDGKLWWIFRDEERETRVQLTGLQVNELSVLKSGQSGMLNRFSKVTAIRDANGAITQTLERPSVADPVIRRLYDGLVTFSALHSSDAGLTYEYDELGRAVKVSDFSNLRHTTYTYDPIYGQTASVTRTANGMADSTSAVWTYYPPDSFARGLQMSEVSTGSTVYSAWTPRGELLAQWGATYPVKYQYDAAGRLGAMHTYRVDPGTAGAASSPVTWSGGDLTEWLYHPGTALVQQKKDAAAKGVAYTYDSRGRVLVRRWARQVSGQPITTTYSYNGADELRHINYSDSTPDVTFGRDARGRVISVSDIDGQKTYSHNDDGTVAWESIIAGNTPGKIEYGYDGVGRRRGYAVRDGVEYITWQGWQYDAANGRDSGISTEEGFIPFVYDEQKNLFAGWTVPGGVHASLGQLAVNVIRSYDNLGRVSGAHSTNNWNLPGSSRTYTYDARHRRTALLEENGEKWNYTYNERNEVLTGNKTYVDNSSATRNMPGMYRGYEYDAIGNRTKLQINENDQVWTINSLNQIAGRGVQEKEYILGESAPAPASVTVSAVGDQVYSAPSGVAVTRGLEPKAKNFSAAINLQQMEKAKNLKVTIQENNGGIVSDETGHIFVPSSPESFTYDDDGNLTQDGRWVYRWDAENRLVGMETRPDLTVFGPDPLPLVRISFSYDAYSRRVSKRVEKKNGAGVYEQQSFGRFVYDGWSLIAEWRAQPNDLKLFNTYHWGLDISKSKAGAGGVAGLIMIKSAAPGANALGSVSIPAYDGNGNIINLTDARTGVSVASYSYGPFGELLSATGKRADINPFRYSTKYFDSECGIYCYGYRYYSPKFGRWLSRDPIGEEGGHNLAAFLGNRPISDVDAYGLVGIFDLFDNSITTSISVDKKIGRLGFSVKVEVKIFTCCNKDCLKEQWLQGEVSVGVSGGWGIKLWEDPSAQIKGADRNKWVPHPCKPGSFIKMKDFPAAKKACDEKKRDNNAGGAVNLNLGVDCPDKEGQDWGGKVSVEGSVGAGFGVQGKVELELDRALVDSAKSWDAFTDQVSENASAQFGFGWIGGAQAQLTISGELSGWYVKRLRVLDEKCN